MTLQRQLKSVMNTVRSTGINQIRNRMHLAVLILLFVGPFQTRAQGPGYNFAIGLRAGETSGLTLKKSIANSSAIEGIIGLRNYGGSVTVLWEKYQPAFNTKGFSWYYGIGGHVGWYHRYRVWYYEDKRDRWYRYYDYDNRYVLGIDGIIGLEYKIPGAPIAFSLDLKPFIEFGDRGGFFTQLDPGLGIKVAL